MLADATLRPLDIAAILAYLGVMAAVGIFFARRKSTTESYFVGNRAFPGWAVGISMFATSISSVTFLAFPGAAYKLDWRQLVPNLALPVVTVLALVVFVPFFRRAGVTSAFEYLEDRFGPILRLYGAVSFIFMQFVRLGTVLYLVSIPVWILTGMHIVWVILIVGVIVAFYTVIGGLEAVIWIDVIQGLVLILGAMFPVAYVLWKLPGGAGEVITVGMAHQKFCMGDMRWNLAERTFPVMVLIGLFNWLSEYSANQNVIQRYLAAASAREARKATLMCAVMSLPIWVFFFFLGTSLFALYRRFPDPAVDGLAADAIFPHFILTQLPAGIAGLVTAGLLAATMSLDSSINSVATVATVDLVKRHICPGRDDAFYLRTARFMSIVAAVAMIGGAIVFFYLPKESMVDLGLIIAAVFGGGLTGIFLVGFFTMRATYGSVLASLACTIVLNIYLVLCAFHVLPRRLTVPVHPYWIGVTVNITLMILAYLFGCLGVGRRRELQRLTAWTAGDAGTAAKT